MSPAELSPKHTDLVIRNMSYPTCMYPTALQELLSGMGQPPLLLMARQVGVSQPWVLTPRCIFQVGGFGAFPIVNVPLGGNKAKLRPFPSKFRASFTSEHPTAIWGAVYR